MARLLLIWCLCCAGLTAPFGCAGKAFSLSSSASSSSSSSSEESDEQVTNSPGRDQLLTIMIESYLQLVDTELAQSKQLIQKVLQDESVLAVHTETMQAEQLIMENFVRQVLDKEKETPPAKTNLANRFFYLVSKSLIYQEFEAIERRHNTTTPHRPAPTAETYVIERALKKHGLEMYERDLLQQQSKFIEEFLKAVKSYIEGLSPAEKKKEHKLVRWYESMQAETDLEKRMELFAEFLRFFLKY